MSSMPIYSRASDDMEMTRKRQAVLTRGKCRYWAKKLRCAVVLVRYSPGRRIVYGPASVYGPNEFDRYYDGEHDYAFAFRDDPYVGDNHVCHGWIQAWEHLQWYKVDLEFWRYDISSGDARDILTLSQGNSIYQEWVEQRFSRDVRMVWADTLEDIGHERLANLIRGME